MTNPVMLEQAASETDTNIAYRDFDYVIQSRRRLFDLPLKQLWQSSELLYFLVWRNFKVRYNQAVIGAGWAVLKPLMLMLVFVAVFGLLIRAPTGDTPYSIIVYTGILPWTLVSTVIGSAGASLIAEAPLLSRVRFPRLIAPLSAALMALIDLLVSIPVLVGLLLWYDIPLTPRLLFLPLFVMLIFLLANSIGLIVAVLQVRYDDIGLLLPILLQVWMYATPIIYPISLVPDRYLTIYSFNPLVGLVQGVRWSMLDVPPPSGMMMLASLMITLVLLGFSIIFFHHAEDTFADYV